MPLQVDYRPEDFDEMVGNETVLGALEKKLLSKDIPNAFLITGPSGCGKTTVGRIIANRLGAYDPQEDVNSNFHEYDAADFRGIDHIRGMRSTMRLMPVGDGKARIFLLDECHQLTKDAQEALLKALEDCPKLAFFVLCTTDPQKLKVTLKRRCAHYAMTEVETDELVAYLQDIIESEEKEVSEEMLEMIVEQANGSPGIALGLLDAIIDLDEDQMEESLRAIKETNQEAIELCKAMLKGQPWKKISTILKGLKDQDPEKIRRGALAYCASILLNGKQDMNAYIIMDAFREPFYDMPYQQLVLACFETLYASEDE